MKKAKQKNVELMLPVDLNVAKEVSEDAQNEIVTIQNIPHDFAGVDIGPLTIKNFSDKLKEAKTVIWNGPMGVFEINKFAYGTFEIAKTLANIDAVTIIGGGDSASAIEKTGLSDKMTHISTGGGASLEFLEGKELPGIKCLLNK